MRIAVTGAAGQLGRQVVEILSANEDHDVDLPAIAALAGQLWETPIDYVGLTPAGYRVELARTGLEQWWCYAFSTMFDSVRQQHWARVSDEVSRLTGHQPRSIRDLLTQATPHSAAIAPGREGRYR